MAQPLNADLFHTVYRAYYRASGGGADGHVEGLGGSLNPTSIGNLLAIMAVGAGNVVLDMGSGDNRFLIYCRVLGAPGMGIELPANQGSKYVFEAARQELQPIFNLTFDDVEWRGENIDQVL